MKAVSLLLTATILLAGSFSFAADASLLFKSAGKLTYQKLNEKEWPAYKGEFDGKSLSDVLAAIVLTKDLGSCESGFCPQTRLKRSSFFFSSFPIEEVFLINGRHVQGKMARGKFRVSTQEVTIISIPESCKTNYLYTVEISFQERIVPGQPSSIDPRSVTVEVIPDTFGEPEACKNY